MIIIILMIRCKKIVYPNVFDDKQQYCDIGGVPDNNFCLGKDMNMFCTDVSINISNTILSKAIVMIPTTSIKLIFIRFAEYRPEEWAKSELYC